MSATKTGAENKENGINEPHATTQHILLASGVHMCGRVCVCVGMFFCTYTNRRCICILRKEFSETKDTRNRFQLVRLVIVVM